MTVTLVTSMGNDELVARAAWVSTDCAHSSAVAA